MLLPVNKVSKRIACAKRAVRAVCIGLILVSTVSCRGASPDWNGTWKLNPAKGDIPGPSIVVSISPDGMWHNTSHGGSPANFRCDGKEYQQDTLTISCRQVNGLDVELTGFRNGSRLFVAHWELSPDEKVLSVKGTMLRADGSVKAIDARYTRTSGSTGFAGGWRDVNPLNQAQSIEKISLQGNTLHRYFPENDRHLDITLDGTDADLGVPRGATLALEERSPREFSLTMKQNGQVVSVGNWQISADGRSLTESYWAPSTPNEKALLVYEKQ
jgi:hypothetical protein